MSFATTLFLALLLGPGQTASPPAAPAGEWRQYERPEAAGFSSAALEEARLAAERAGSAAVLAVHRGHVLAAWGEVERRFECHSVRKSLVSALVGIHVERGTLALDATLAELGIDDEPPLDDEEKEARLSDLLAARSGIYHPAAKEPADMKAERPERGSRRPGEAWWYNNWDFNTVGVILERAAQQDLYELFRGDLAAPLGMQDFRLEDGLAEYEPSSSIHPAHAFRMSARDLARIGWLFACAGEWNGATVVPRAWVAESTRAHTVFENGRGYGYMWWVYPAGSLGGSPELDRHDCFAAIGTGGQLVLVVPAAEYVFVHRGDTDNEREVRGPVVWDLAERVLAARRGEPEPAPALVPVRALPLGAPAPPWPERTALALAPEELAEYAGEYAAEDGLVIDVHVWRGRLFAHARGMGETELFAEARDRFFSKAEDVQVRFERDGAGKIDGVAATLVKREVFLARER
jgi:CubicO group peptidase (beta-lactamase class C family)